MIPFIDLSKQYEQIEVEINDAIFKVIQQNAFVQGGFVSEFESSFAKKLNIKNCIGVGNGTDALSISLKILGIKQGDEVITAANTFIATSEAISHCGATPIFVDHDDFYGINVEQIESKITSNTKAIIPVHLYGQAVEIDTIQKICKKHNLFLIEDCAQSHFSKFGDNYTGTFGDIATYSFYPGKNLGAYGDGGAIVTNDNDLANQIRMYCNHGSLQKNIHQIEGINSRLDGIQAAILSVKLKYINEWNKMRFDAAMKYNLLLSNCKEIVTPKLRTNTTSVFHLYVIQANRRDELQQFLQQKEIQTGMHYKTALPFAECYKKFNYAPTDFPISYANQSKILSLPMYAEITDEQIEKVCNSIIEFYQ
jgi:dTDP-4-amino-4,6-dideoxygalactose transaminase